MFSRRTLIRHHLSANLFPPLPDTFAAAAERAIDLANAGDFRAEVTLPTGAVMTALECLDLLRLDVFVDGLEP